MKTYAMMVLGCKVNDYEAAYLKEQMDQDYEEVNFKDKADIYIIFTCCVTNIAESKTRKFIRQARRHNPDAYVVAVGCLSQARNDDPVFDEVNLIIGSRHKDKIKEYIDSAINANMVENLTDVQFENLYLHNYKRKNRAFLKIQDGCNQFCSYCIIPYSRGRERSGQMADIINAAKQLALNSPEIVLTGIHTGRYFDGKHHLVDLLKELEKIEGLKTLRLSSIEINELTDELLTFMKESKKMAHHLHIPLQAGSNHVLELMHRPYTLEYFFKRVDYIRTLMPGISISTDLIVGFPSESDQDFADTLDFLKKIRFSFIHLFPYAAKKGTLACQMPDQIDPLIKKDRERAVIALQKDISLAFKESYINKKAEVFIEKNTATHAYGYTKEYIYTAIKGNFKIGDIVKVKLIGINDDTMIGEICY